MVSINRRNDYSKKNLFWCSFGHLDIVLRQTWKIVVVLFDAGLKFSNYFLSLFFLFKVCDKSHEHDPQEVFGKK